MISNRCARKSLVTNCNSIISKNYLRFLVDSNESKRKMIKTDIVDYVINNTTLSRSQAINATDSVIEAISHSLIKGESVFIRGFATIKAVITAPKKARNINKGTAVTIPAQHSAKLVLSKDLKERMNKK